ncbi:hypothetical protein B0H11DRAFT_1903822 [Mycena galericulata]|nr:hypothetical protein B0H11DRAFT_1903822 [Mycena galericulata]
MARHVTEAGPVMADITKVPFRDADGSVPIGNNRLGGTQPEGDQAYKYYRRIPRRGHLNTHLSPGDHLVTPTDILGQGRVCRTGTGPGPKAFPFPMSGVQAYCTRLLRLGDAARCAPNPTNTGLRSHIWIQALSDAAHSPAARSVSPAAGDEGDAEAVGARPSYAFFSYREKRKYHKGWQRRGSITHRAWQKKRLPMSVNWGRIEVGVAVGKIRRRGRFE